MYQPKFVTLFVSPELRSVNRDTGEFEHVAVQVCRRGPSVEYTTGIVRTKHTVLRTEIAADELPSFGFYPKHGFDIQALLHCRQLLDMIIASHESLRVEAARANVEDARVVRIATR